MTELHQIAQEIQGVLDTNARDMGSGNYARLSKWSLKLYQSIERETALDEKTFAIEKKVLFHVAEARSIGISSVNSDGRYVLDAARWRRAKRRELRKSMKWTLRRLIEMAD
tara:strand:+ start:348 stop:680 length:333 start_codon:yes stop_codon:yes gene_type:complete